MTLARPIAGTVAPPLGGDGLPWSDGGGAPLWTPAQLPGLRCWLRADLGVSLVGADVDAWADQSGVGNVFSAAAAGNRPLFVAAVSEGNNQPGVQFDGAAEYLRDTAFSWGATTNPHSIFLVYRQDGLTAGDIIVCYGAANRPALRQAAGSLFDYLGAAGAVTSTSTTSLSGVVKLIGGTWNGATQRVYTSGTQEDSDANAGASSADGETFALGGRSDIPGSLIPPMTLLEVIACASLLGATEIAALQAYKVRRYGGT